MCERFLSYFIKAVLLFPIIFKGFQIQITLNIFHIKGLNRICIGKQKNKISGERKINYMCMLYCFDSILSKDALNDKTQPPRNRSRKTAKIIKKMRVNISGKCFKIGAITTEIMQKRISPFTG